MRIETHRAAPWVAAAASVMVLGIAVSSRSAPEGGAPPNPADDALRAQIDGKTPQQRVEFLNAVVEDEKATKEVFFHLGNAKFEAGDTAGAAAAFEKAVAMDSTFFKAAVNLGLMYDEQQMYPKAIETLESAARLQPNNPDIWAHIGNTYYAQRDYAKANDLYKKALSIDAQAQLPLYHVAVSFADAGIFREAVKYWGRVVQVDSTSELGRNATENIDLVKKYLIP